MYSVARQSLFRVAQQNWTPARNLVTEIPSSRSIACSIFVFFLVYFSFLFVFVRLAEVSKWKFISFVGAVPIVGLTVFLFGLKDHDHEHKDE
jgi:hypothetical protein